MASFALPLEWLDEWRNSGALTNEQMRMVLWGVTMYAAGVNWDSKDPIVNAFIAAYRPQVDRIKNYRGNAAGPGRKGLIPDICQGIICQMRKEGKSAREIAEYLNSEFKLGVKADNIFHSEGWKAAV